ncbi:MAG: pitrilysin family protein [Clostridia bacterium]|nr:pitrilysin family protein [Clostridia bacterium]
MQKVVIAEGINLYMLPDEKFKNCVTSVFFSVPLKRETASAVALIPKLLTASNAKYKDRQSLNLELENMYGARLQAFADKVGETQIIGFVGDSVADRYTGEQTESEMFSLLAEIITNPRKTDHRFDERVLEREKKSLIEKIESVVNDKRQYAMVRLVEEMCKDEPFAIRAEGNTEDVQALTAERVYEVYMDVLQNEPVDILIAGAFDVERAMKNASVFATKLGSRKAERKRKNDIHVPEHVKYVRDKEPVTQGKLVIGYRTEIDPLSEEYYTLMVYNSIFGGSTSAKLFNEVREKMSLCYYASSGIERMKGLLFVQSGIEFANYEVALEAIRKEAKAIEKGEISRAEFEGAKNSIINQLRSCKDTPAALISFYARQLPLGVLTEIDLVIKKIMAVVPEQIPIVARLIHEDTVYFLDGREGKAV